MTDSSTTIPDDLHLTVAQVASIAGTSVSRIRGLASRGAIPVIQPTERGQMFVKASDLDAVKEALEAPRPTRSAQTVRSFVESLQQEVASLRADVDHLLANAANAPSFGQKPAAATVPASGPATTDDDELPF